MQGIQIDKILKRDPVIGPIYGGIWCQDTLKYPLTENTLWVLNTALSSDSLGEHWLVIHTLSENSVEYLCSSKTSYKNFPHVAKCIEGYNKTIYSFSHATQTTWSTSCGTHVLFNSFCVSRKIFGKEILKKFFLPYIKKRTLYKAEIFVAEVTQQLFNLRNGLTQKLILDLKFLKQQIKHKKKRVKERRKK